MTTKFSDYRLPLPWDEEGNPTKEDAKLGWLVEGIQQGTDFLKSQRAYSNIDQAIDLLYGPDDERLPRTLSRLHVNRMKRQIREVVATMSNIRPVWTYSCDNKQYETQTLVLKKMRDAWWHSTFADRKIREAIQYACVEGTGYVSPIWEKDYWVTGRGDIELHSYGARDVLPIQLPRSHDLQKAYAVIIRVETPIAMAHAMYPLHADRIFPDRTQPGWLRRGAKRVQRFLSPVLNLADNERDREVTCPTVDIYNVYILDTTVNNTGKVLAMGEPGTNWAYTVPYVGMDIPAGFNDPQGRPLLRKATWEDSLIYPMRRLFIGTKSAELRDGPSPWWHGMVPLVKVTMDDWVFEYLGLSLVRDGASIQNSRNRLMRVIDDSAHARLRPPLAYDESISKTAMDRFDTRQPNQRVQVNMSMGEVIKPIMNPEYYNVEPWIANYLGLLAEEQDYVMAHRDMASLARARQLPAADTIEKLWEVLGPIPQDQSRNQELAIRGLGMMWKSLAFQFYGTARRVQIAGAMGAAPEDYDYDPGNLIPARTHDEATEPYFRRVRRHADNFIFQVQPYSAHQITQLGRQMVLMQLFRGGFPIDPWTMAESFDLPDFGPAPEGTKNMIERWVAWMRMRGELQADIQQIVASAMQGGGLAQLLGMANPPGRPPSGNAPPEIAIKDGGSRSTVTESR